MAEQANWYVVHTYSGYENKVAQDLMTMVENRRLQDLICDVKVPTETVIEEVLDKTGNKTCEKEVQRKLYPGYVFVKMVMNDNTGTLSATPAAALALSARPPSRSP